MKRTILLLFLTVLTAIGLSARTASQLMAQAATKLNSAGSVEVSFTMTTDNGPVKGSLIMQQKAYTMSTPMITIWYDGNNQWVYSTHTAEVSLTTPTADELLETNPFFLINDYSTMFNLAEGSGSSVVLTPKSAKNNVNRAVITFGSDGWPTKLTVTFSNGASAVVTVNEIITTTKKTMGTFRFDSSKYPDAELIDLR